MNRNWSIPSRVNCPALPRSGLPAPRLVSTGFLVSASELVPDVDTAVPDCAGDFPSQAVRSVPLLPDGHSATIDSARFWLRLNTVTVRDAVSIVLPDSPVWVVNVLMNAQINYAALYPLLTPSLCSGGEEGA